MHYKKQQNSLLPIRFLLCSLLTLTPNEKIFKTINLKKGNYRNLYELNYMMASETNLYAVLNKRSLRQLVYTILGPFLLIEDISNTTKKDSFTKTVLLKKYLKKFRYTYYRYFQSGNNENYQILTNKELNNLAIRSLFTILGV